MRRFLITLFFAVLSITALSGCNDGPLLSSLNQRQSNEVLAALHKHQVQAVKIPQGKGLYAISVPAEQSQFAISILQEYQLPSSERVEIAGIFPSDALIASPQSERARLISAIEQRLEQSVSSFDEVAEARVHLSYPTGDGRKKNQEPPGASVLIYHTGIDDEDQFTSDIQAFVMNAFSGLTGDNVSVILHHKPVVIAPPPASPQSPDSPYTLPLIVVCLLLGGGILWLQRTRLAALFRLRREKHHG